MLVNVRKFTEATLALQVLQAAGLKCTIDIDVFKTAAQHLSDRFHLASGQAAEREVIAVAEDLMRWLKPKIFDLSISGPFYRAIQNISFVPALQVGAAWYLCAHCASCCIEDTPCPWSRTFCKPKTIIRSLFTSRTYQTCGLSLHSFQVQVLKRCRITLAWNAAQTV